MSSLCFIFNTEILKEQVLLLPSFHPNCLGREGAADAKASTAGALRLAQALQWLSAATGHSCLCHQVRAMTANSEKSHRAITNYTPKNTNIIILQSIKFMESPGP